MGAFPGGSDSSSNITTNPAGMAVEMKDELLNTCLNTRITSSRAGFSGTASVDTTKVLCMFQQDCAAALTGLQGSEGSNAAFSILS